jgi:16S rRNA (adenine1518-N6/adenine1519-N6)-dimethyltransferase
MAPRGLGREMKKGPIPGYAEELKRRRLGQHFLVDESVMEKLIEEVEALRPRLVIEVGVGFGGITVGLAGVAERVVGVERDKRLFEVAKKRLESRGNVELIQGDILMMDFPSDAVVVGAPPYSISTRIVGKIIHSKVGSSILILQKDFVERMVRGEGDPRRSYLSALVAIFGRVEHIEEVGRESFHPRPKVDSQLVKIIVERNRDMDSAEIKRLNGFLAQLYRQRRRFVRRALLGPWKRGAQDRGDLGEKRVFELSTHELLEVYGLIRHEG